MLKTPVSNSHHQRSAKRGHRAPAAVSAAAMAAAATLLIALSSGCGAGHDAPPSYSIFPETLVGGNVVAAGETIDFSGQITNSTSRVPYFVVEKLPEESTYDFTDTKVTKTNFLRGTVDSTTGVYTAPTYLPDDVSFHDAINHGPASAITDVIDLISTDQANDIKAQIDSARNVLKNSQNSVISLSFPPVVLNDLRAEVKLNPFTDQQKITQLESDEFSHFVTSMPPSQRATTSFKVVHKIVLNPQTVSVTLRGTQRLADYLTVKGDPFSDNANNKHVTFQIQNPASGAGGSINPDTGVYTAPNILPAQIANLHDTILVTSLADPSVTAQITVNIVSGAGSVTVQ